MKSKLFGNFGEAKAYAFLEQNGYEIVETNYQNFIGEIDIVAFDEQTLCFVEVKARSSKKFGLPREAVGFAKQNKIRMTASVFLQKTKIIYTSCRFDVVEILDDDITLIKNAF